MVQVIQAITRHDVASLDLCELPQPVRLLFGIGFERLLAGWTQNRQGFASGKLVTRSTSKADKEVVDKLVVVQLSLLSQLLNKLIIISLLISLNSGMDLLLNGFQVGSQFRLLE